MKVKKLVEEAFARVGGADYLVRQAELNPVAFMSLLGKILPRQINADVTVDVVKWAEVVQEADKRMRALEHKEGNVIDLDPAAVKEIDASKRH